MATIKEDQFGLYVSAGGYKARPIFPTNFKVGDKPKTHHYGGSTRAGIGKDATCIRGQYLETWLTCGISASEKVEPEKEKLQISWYKVRANFDPFYEPSEQECNEAREYEAKYFGRS